MERWKNLESNIVEYLRSQSSSLTFRNSNQAIVGFPSNGFRSDGMLTDGKSLLAVEVEVTQAHPDTNVGKYWFLHERSNNQYEKIALIHIYTPLFNSYGWRMTLGEFYVDKMKKIMPFEYHLLDYRKSMDFDQDYPKIISLIDSVITDQFKK